MEDEMGFFKDARVREDGGMEKRGEEQILWVGDHLNHLRLLFLPLAGNLQ
jgi:hypothetical protein